MNPTQGDFQKQLAERFHQLPKVVQDAITSTDIEKRLRELATAHKLHVDEWDALENEVMLTILGFQRPEDLATNIQKETSISIETARGLAESISAVVFDPIRKELERQLEHPSATTETQNDIEISRSQILGGAENTTSQSEQPVAPAPIIPPATPPIQQPTVPVARMPASGAYKPGEASHVRTDVIDDPYREPPQ